MGRLIKYLTNVNGFDRWTEKMLILGKVQRVKLLPDGRYSALSTHSVYNVYIKLNRVEWKLTSSILVK